MKVEIDIGNPNDYGFLNEFTRLKRLKPDLTWDDIIWTGILEYMNEMEGEDGEADGGMVKKDDEE